ncbi:MAG: LON peptidase substrate-binding domain-containing protein [Sphingobacteriia bacterium]|jgi:Lon protease-like protein
MINFIPVFPLGIVVFPGESLNLHIFEPRYKELITDCFAEKKPFGIPTVIKSGVSEMGTLVEIEEIVAVHPDGKMDIKTKGIKVFSILELVKSIPDKLYSGAIVSYPENEIANESLLIKKLLALIFELHRLLEVKKDFKKTSSELLSYDLAHHVGLSLDEEYELLGLLKEPFRIEYLKRHLNKVLPIMAGMETLKEKIQLNGHFKELKGFNFDQ